LTQQPTYWTLFCQFRNKRHVLGSRYRFLLCIYRSIGGSF